MYSCVPASFLPALQPASLTSRPNGYAPNLLDRLAALSSIERLPRRARSYGLVWARGIVAASAGDRFIRMPEHQPLTHARAAPVQSVLASSSPYTTPESAMSVHVAVSPVAASPEPPAQRRRSSWRRDCVAVEGAREACPCYTGYRAPLRRCTGGTSCRVARGVLRSSA